MVVSTSSASLAPETYVSFFVEFGLVKNKEKIVSAVPVAVVVTYRLDFDCRNISGRQHHLAFLAGSNCFLFRPGKLRLKPSLLAFSTILRLTFYTFCALSSRISFC